METTIEGVGFVGRNGKRDRYPDSSSVRKADQPD